MTLAICLDEGGGNMFFSRRQSADSAVIRRIREIARGGRLVVTEYSASLFKDGAVIGDADRTDDVYFAEDALPALDLFDRIVIFRWNKKYPRDGVIPLSPYDGGFTLDSMRDFTGTSHGRITEEIWIRR